MYSPVHLLLCRRSKNTILHAEIWWDPSTLAHGRIPSCCCWVVGRIPYVCFHRWAGQHVHRIEDVNAIVFYKILYYSWWIGMIGDPHVTTTFLLYKTLFLMIAHGRDIAICLSTIVLRMFKVPKYFLAVRGSISRSYTLTLRLCI